MLKQILRAILPIVISALGGAMMVYSSYDDSPGGSGIGLLMIVFSIYIAIKQKKTKP